MSNIFTDPADFLAKLDWEGSDGIEWFNPDEFEDPTLAQAVEDAKYHHAEFNKHLDIATTRALELTDAEG